MARNAKKIKALRLDVTREQAEFISAVVERADMLATMYRGYPFQDLRLDLSACEMNGCPMDWQKLLDCGDFDFVHDVWGIHRHIDRNTGVLGGNFLPRCAMP